MSTSGPVTAEELRTWPFVPEKASDDLLNYAAWVLSSALEEERDYDAQLRIYEALRLLGADDMRWGKNGVLVKEAHPNMVILTDLTRGIVERPGSARQLELQNVLLATVELLAEEPDAWISPHDSHDSAEIFGHDFPWQSYGDTARGDVPIVTPELTISGDYGGSGLVGKSNMLWFRQNLAEHVTFWYSAHDTTGVGIPIDRPIFPEIFEVLDRLEGYPLLDEELHSELEIDAQTEAWPNDGLEAWIDALSKYIAQWWLAVDDPLPVPPFETGSEYDEAALAEVIKEVVEAAANPGLVEQLYYSLNRWGGPFGEVSNLEFHYDSDAMFRALERYDREPEVASGIEALRATIPLPVTPWPSDDT